LFFTDPATLVTTTTGIVKTGSGSTIDFGLVSAGGTYTVVARNPVTLCTNNMSGSVLVSISTLPVSYVVTGGGNYCVGGSGYPVGLSFSSLGINYKLYKGVSLVDSLAGTGLSLNYGNRPQGTYTVVGTNMATGCSSNMVGNAVVNPPSSPTLYLVSVKGSASYCAGTPGSEVVLNGSDPSTVYQLYSGPLPVGSPVAGTGSPLTFGSHISGTYTVIATSALSCTATMNGSAAITQAATPVAQAITVTNGGAYCAGPTGVSLKLSGSEAGVNYQLYANGVPVYDASSPMPGTGLILDFGLRKEVSGVPTTYTIIGTNAGSSCTNTMANSVLVTANPLPTAFTVTDGGGYCVGGSGSHVRLSYSDPGVSYQLYQGVTPVTGGTLPGVGGILDFGLQKGIGAYSVVATNVATGCTNNMSGTVSVYTTPLPNIYSITGGGDYCAGSTGVKVGLSASNLGIDYQLSNGGVPVSGIVHGTGIALDFGLQTLTGTYTVSAVNATTGCANIMSGSKVINVNALPASYGVTGGGDYCIGGSGKSVGLSMSDAGISYQLFNVGTKAGPAMTGTGAALDFGSKKSTGIYEVTGTDLATGCTSAMSGSTTINTDPLPAAFTVSGGGGYCAGGTGANVLLGGSEPGVNYQLFNAGTAMGGLMAGTGLGVDFGAQTAAGAYTVVGYNAVTGCSAAMTSAVSVIINAAPAVYAVSGGGDYCAGGTGKGITLSNSNLGITYQLYNGASKDGFAIWGTGAPLNLGVHAAAGTYTVQAVNAATGCVADMTSSALINIIPVVIPSVSITAMNGTMVCAGSTDSFMVASMNGGTAPTYTWQVDGVVMTGDTLFNYTPAKTGEVVKVTMASNAQCAVPATVTNSVIMTVNPVGAPTVTMSEDPGNTVCKGSMVTFGVQSSTFGGAAPAYAWKVGGTLKGTSNTYSYKPANNDVVSLEMSSNDPCRSADVATNSVTMTVKTTAAPVFTIKNHLPGSLATGQSDTLEAVITANGGTSPTYQWVVNGVALPGETHSMFITSNLFDKDSVACIVTGSDDCGTAATAHSTIMSVHSLGVHGVAGNTMDVRVIPNPNSGAFTIKGDLGNTVDEAVTLEITNMLGQVVYNNKVMSHQGKLNEQVQLNNALANGVYLLNVHSGSANNVFHFVVEK
jgi:hypothetical protein